ncbi:hypothetical protein D3C73_965940 [compost metagenome]
MGKHTCLPAACAGHNQKWSFGRFYSLTLRRIKPANGILYVNKLHVWHAPFQCISLGCRKQPSIGLVQIHLRRPLDSLHGQQRLPHIPVNNIANDNRITKGGRLLRFRLPGNSASIKKLAVLYGLPDFL